MNHTKDNDEVQRAIRLSEQRCRMALEATDLTVWNYDLRRRQFFRTAYQSGEIQKMDVIEGAYEKMIQQKHVLPESLEEYRRIHRELEEGRLRTEGIIHFDDQRSAVNWLKIKYTVVEQEDGENVLAIGIAEDVTALMEAEEWADYAKTDFLSRMSHDIRTPMNAIIGLTGIALDEQPKGRVQECLEKIDRSSRFLMGLINDILDMSKSEGGKLELHPEKYPLQEFRSMMDTLIRPMMEEKKIQFDCHMPEGNPFIYEDKLRFNQVFINLLTNAAKFTEEGGKVSFTATRIGQENSVTKMKFVIQDNGIGMSREFLEHAFEPFEQEHNGIIHQFQGTGLGLSMAKQLVELMGGSIQMESTEGAGTKVTVVLPIHLLEEPERKEIISQSMSSGFLAGKRLLLVEDNKINTMVAQRILEKAGATVEHVANGAEAVDVFQENPAYYYDGILMDILMPVMNGLEAAGRIRALAREDAGRIPIIAMSANTFPEDVRKSLGAGMNAHLPKPVDPKKLYDTLNHFLQP